LVVAQGPREKCQRLLDLLQAGNTPGTVDNVLADFSERTEAISGFSER
jgi:acylphosphatase